MLSLTPASISSDSSAMWGHILLIFLAGLPLFSAAPQDGSSDLCPLNMEILKLLLLNNKEVISKLQNSVNEVANRLINVEADSKKGIQDISEKLLNENQKTNSLLEKIENNEEKISGMNSSLLAKMNSGFEKVENHEENAASRSRKVIEEVKSIGVKVDQSERNLIKEGRDLADDTKHFIKGLNISSSCEKARKLPLTRLPSPLGLYYFSRNATSWRGAQKFCLENGMQLATFETDDKRKQVVDAIPGKVDVKNYGYWVGASDIGREPGQFFWTDGRKVNSSFWASGNPNYFGSGKEACVNVGATNGKLYDNNCNINYFVICELPSVNLPCL